MTLLQKFERNTAGRDFIVADIHGMYDHLRAVLKLVEFDGERDRLFSVGDLVDRGPQSHEAVAWLAEPWFHAVRGNHEQMAMDFASGIPTMEDMYRKNGGGWFIEMAQEQREAFAAAFAELPFAIEIQHAMGRIGIVHADPIFSKWDDLLAKLDDENVQLAVSWSRQRFQYRENSHVEGIAAVFVGHTIVPDAMWLGNVAYIDTGCYRTGKLTLVELRAGEIVCHQTMAPLEQAA